LVIDVVFLSCIMVTGLVVNTVALVFLLRKKSTSTLKDKVIIVLCIINVLQSTGFGIELNAAIKGSVTTLWCKTAGFIICFLTYTSIGYFLILAIERYVAILRPLHYGTWFTFRNTMVLLVLPPLYGLSIGALPLVGWSGYARPRNNSIYCTYDFQLQSTKGYFMFTSVVVFIGPIVLTTACFTCILLELKGKVSQTRRRYGKNSDLTANSSKSMLEQSLSSMLAIFVYIFSWLPYCLVCFEYFADRNVSVEFEDVAKFLSKASTILSIVVYCLIERKFRCFFRDKMSKSIGMIGNQLVGISKCGTQNMVLVENELPL